MLSSVEFVASGTRYSVCYTARGRFLFERLSGYPLGRLSAFRGEVSDVELAHLVVAGLEGHRRKENARKAAWTVDEVLDDILGELDATEREAVFRACLEAVAAAFRTAEDKTEAAKGAEGKASTVG